MVIGKAVANTRIDRNTVTFQGKRAPNAAIVSTLSPKEHYIERPQDRRRNSTRQTSIATIAQIAFGEQIAGVYDNESVCVFR